MVVVLAACGSADDGGSAGSPVGDWIAVSGTSDGSNVELIEGFAVKISIDDDQVAGTAACNRYSGGVSIGSDGSFQVDGLSWTEIGCEPAVLELEQSFLAALGRRHELRRRRRRLDLERRVGPVGVRFTGQRRRLTWFVSGRPCGTSA